MKNIINANRPVAYERAEQRNKGTKEQRDKGTKEQRIAYVNNWPLNWGFLAIKVKIKHRLAVI